MMNANIGQTTAVTGKNKDAQPAIINNGGSAGKYNPTGASEFQGLDFSPDRPGNTVTFFTTGEEYFADAVAEMKKAKESIFITGWQTNFDVILQDGVRLWDVLSEALNNSPTLKVYVMPWLSPKAPVDTGDFETMMAIFLLNAGLKGPIRAFCMPAMEQSGDMESAAISFSHHQKAVIIDNKIAYVGGLDFAYGRRDDAKFSLKMGWRNGRERYNSCIPPVGEVPKDDQWDGYLTTSELLITIFMEGDGITKMTKKFKSMQRDYHQFKKSLKDKLAAPDTWHGKIVNAVSAASATWDKVIANGKKRALEYGRKTAASFIDRNEQAIEDVYKKLMPDDWEKFIEYHRTVGGGVVTNAVVVAANWLNNHTLDNMPGAVQKDFFHAMRMILMRCYTIFVHLSDMQYERYSFLANARYGMLPPGGKMLDASRQPRMPWQDAMAKVVGPSVYDISMNFVRRWNSLQYRLNREYGQWQIPGWIDELIGGLTSRELDKIRTKVLDALNHLNGELEKNYNFRIDRNSVEEFKKYVEGEIKNCKRILEGVKDASEPRIKAAQEQVKTRLAAFKEEVNKRFEAIKQQIHTGLAAKIGQERANKVMDVTGKVAAKTSAKASAKASATVESLVGAAENSIRETVAYLKAYAAAWTKRPEPMYIPEELVPAEPKGPGSGGCMVQVARSAPLSLIRDEEDAIEVAPGMKKANPVRFTKMEGKMREGKAQDNCQKDIVGVITHANHFVYIEGQFFQSDYGEDDRMDKAVLSGPMGYHLDITRIPNYDKYKEELEVERAWNDGNFAMMDATELVEIALKDPKFFGDLKRAFSNKAMVEATKAVKSTQMHMENKVCRAIGDRIKRAIYEGNKFHVYIVLPVYPEGMLDTIALMNQTYLTMQSLHFGQNSLINRIRRAVAAKKLKDEHPGMSVAEAEKQIAKLDTGELEEKYRDVWKNYLTLLNLRNYDVIGNRAVTEQIYVHTKLVLADDLVLVLGSANINDRSMLGCRDSEIAIWVHDKTALKKPITGGPPIEVGKAIHEFRVALWAKHFGITGDVRPATELKAVLDKPAAEATWKAIQAVAERNAGLYEAAFPFIPRNVSASNVQADNNPPRPEEEKKQDPVKGKRGASLWPGWHYENPYHHDVGVNAGNGIKILHPWDEDFWAKPKQDDKKKPAETPKSAADGTKESFLDQCRQLLGVLLEDEVDKDAPPVPESTAPRGVEGFIVALPTLWSAGENNSSGMSLELIAQAVDQPLGGDAIVQPQNQTAHV
ncbi:MAG: hypothetical protein LBI92_04115 [Azoarcus sp.]|nr:hypothetical protein [Azoarcus sp.]